MSSIQTSPVAGVGGAYINAQASKVSASVDVVAVAIADKTIRVANLSWDAQFSRFLEVFA